MGLFSRRRTESMDPDLSFMTVSEADELRRLTLSALAAYGIEARVEGGEIVTADGTTVELWNLATICGAANAPEEWPALVSEHVRELVTAVDPVGPEDMTRRQMLEALRLRLAEESYVRGMPQQPAACEPVAPGLVRHLVVETPDALLPVSADVVTAVVPLEEAVTAATEATRTLAERTRLESEIYGEGSGAVRVVFSESPFTATFALDLPGVVDRLDPGADLSRGIVFAVPTRQQIVYHLPTDPESVRAVLPVMLRFAGTAYDEGAGPVSPELYTWQDGHIDALTAPGRDGRVEITPTGALTAFLDG
ncbi:hypothetical protein [Mobilicoccus pelagius]|uniref:Uncharacterized protein n=1 Tax=Mobilicoccus pelagius NBRC 104925 TaxID=1089455 RepID=H5USB5_9MICO|nr:hypothetical protein [Mobilicoccus pelagius]GAB48623.1 hypothetical protein MOPEL_078_00120 [Mobilicoccus pelagius NBRC 104925]